MNISFKKSSALKPRPSVKGLRAVKMDTRLFDGYIIDDFLTPAECKELVIVSDTKFRYSTIDGRSDDIGVRTSKTCMFEEGEFEIVSQIDRKISMCMGIRLPYSENLKIQKYEVGEEFKVHRDYFEPHHGIQRTWTFMVYLTDVERGGETRFTIPDIKVAPAIGRAVVWNNLLPSGDSNANTLHEGMPVLAGQKIIITKWFRNVGQGRAWY